MATQRSVPARTRLGVFAVLATLAAAGCSDGKIPTGNDAADERPDRTARGTPTGPAVTVTVGPEGGSLTSADGLLTLNVPAGAVSATTDFGIQPITNQSPGGVGTGYRLTPAGQTFASPIELTFVLADDALAGGEAEGLGLSYQDEDGGWWAILPTWSDGASGMAAPGRPAALASGASSRSATTSTRRLTDWTLGWVFHLQPFAPKVKVTESVLLDVVACVKGNFNALQGPVPKGACKLSTQEWDWLLERGSPAGNTTIGTLTIVPATSGSILVGSATSRAIYTAPARVPTPRSVIAEARMQGRGSLPMIRTISFIRVEDDCSAAPRRALLHLAHATPADDVCAPIPLRLVATYNRQDQPTIGGYLEVAVTDGFEADVDVYPDRTGLVARIQNSSSTVANPRRRPDPNQICDVQLGGALEQFTADSGAVVPGGQPDSVMIHFFGRYKEPPATVFSRNFGTGACESFFSYPGQEGPTGLFFSIKPGDFVRPGDSRTVVQNTFWTFVLTRK